MAAGDALGGGLNVNADFDSWFVDLLTSLEGWLQILGARLTSWWSALWNGLKVDLSADINVTTNTSGSTNLGRTTPMSGLPVDGGRDNGTFNNNNVSWDSDGNDLTSPSNPNAGALVDNVTAGVVQALAPFIVSQNDADQLPPVYVGTLIADDRGLKELERKLRIIRVKEERRGG